MPLDESLFLALLTYKCPSCAGEISCRGSWIKSIRHFHCDRCGYRAPMTYDNKIKIFERHAARRQN
jgi:hypothetical protein